LTSGAGRDFSHSLLRDESGGAGGWFGIDSNSEAVGVMIARAGREGLHTLEGIVGRGEETVACEGCADPVFFGIDLHDFADPGKVLANARRMMKTRGRLVDLDWKKEQTPFGPHPHIRFSEEEAARLIGEAGSLSLKCGISLRGFTVSPQSHGR